MTHRLARSCITAAVCLLISACHTSAREDSSSANAEIVQTLKFSTDRQELLNAAITLVRSDDPQALTALSGFLRDRDFLLRLDDMSDRHTKTRNVRQIMNALADHPRDDLSSFCLQLAKDSAYTADPDRLDLLLPVLASATPMTEKATSLFRRTNGEGYFAINAPLLTGNGSPRALDLFESMMKDHDVAIERRMDCIHTSIVPSRTNLSVLRVARRLLDDGLEDPMVTAIIESIFDYRSKEWYGTARDAPTPPQWSAAGDEALRAVLDLAVTAREKNVPQALRDRIEETVRIIESELRIRTK